MQFTNVLIVNVSNLPFLQKNVQMAIAEIENHLSFKMQLRNKIQIAIQNRPEESYFSKLDSNIKKNTAFVRKLKNYTEAQKESILKDINLLNLTKYISEVANGIVEAKLKMTDIASIVQVCVTLHEKYSEFSSQLLEAWQKVLTLKKDEKVFIIITIILKKDILRVTTTPISRYRT